ncbi:hypothetical protein [Kocuria tytonis]|uniref:Major facilitator superfamily (MFS) profile domain-containing protein n=1 Tax=Kocuria tytonis TaxID=2054280 RepID=A0A495A5U9_9MICC|nr:hypothetical protein [Kocuria tytonis]RKQ35203.1 hypothetical protein C1C97_008125 [Kocuria tytonis]
MIMSARRLSTGRRLFWVGLASVVLTLVFFFGGFLGGNSLGAETAMGVLLGGLVLSVITSLTALVLGVAGIVAFPSLRGRYVLVLVLAVVCSPLLWLLLLALFS